MEQFLGFKKKHPEAMLLFRMGDFYETFYDDAKEASRVLGLTLTSRNNGRADRIPMAGLPYHALDTYLARLIRAGKKVAICEQMEPPQKGRVVRRDVVQVVSPGTAITDNLLEGSRNNYLAGVVMSVDSYGLAVADLSTGEFRVSEGPAARLWETLEGVAPAELLVTPEWRDAHADDVADRLGKILISVQDDWTFGRAYAYEALTDHFKIASLKGFDCDDLTQGIAAAGAVLCYLQENQRGQVKHVTRLLRERSGEVMTLDLVTQRNLELVASIQDGGQEGTLLSVLDSTCTPPGARALRHWLSRPLLQREAVERRLDAVELLRNRPPLRERLRSRLKGSGDLERLMSRICCGRATPRDVAAVRNSLEAASDVRVLLAEVEVELLATLRDDGMPDLADLILRIEETLSAEPPALAADGGVIREGVSGELDQLRDVASGGRKWVAALQARERERTGIPSLKISYNRAFGYYIEVTKANVERVPEDYTRRQTLVNAERYVTPELKEYEEKILTADERAAELEQGIFRELCEETAAKVSPIQQTARSVAAVDVLACLAEAAAAGDFVRPVIEDSVVLEIREGRHPVVEQQLPRGSFVPNDVTVDGDGDQILIITGPNMAGKSTILRQVGLTVLLAQVGSFVPAKSARIGICDRIFTRVGASDNLARGESTFLVEMNEAARIMNTATRRSLVLLDEIGRGTSTFDGLSIAWAMTEHLHNSDGIRPRTMFATHYHELAELEEILPRVANFSVAVRESGDDVVFLHRLVRGACDHSYGIHVARLAGMPAEVVTRAREVLARLESNDLTMSLSAVRRSRKKGSIDQGQMGLFETNGAPAKEPPPHPVVEELKSLDVNRLTPMEALAKLDAWKKSMECENLGGAA